MSGGDGYRKYAGSFLSSYRLILLQATIQAIVVRARSQGIQYTRSSVLL